MKVGTLCFTSDQGLSYLARDFYTHGIITHPVILAHGRRTDHPEWYPAGTSFVGNYRAPEVFDHLSKCDVVLFFETPFDWQLIPRLREAGVRTVLMPMIECMPDPLPTIPDLLLCPSWLDLQWADQYRKGKSVTCDKCGITYAWASLGYSKIRCPNCWDNDTETKLYQQGVTFLPVPVNVPWRQRTRCEVFIHNAGNGGLRGRNGTRQIIDAMLYIKSPIKLILRSQEGTWMTNDNRVELRIGHQSQETLWDDGDCFLFPEKFNGLSLPLQEARAAGMLVMATDRFPMNTWLPQQIGCPACDSEGSLMYQWAKESCQKVGGYRKFFGDRGQWTYYTAEHKEMCLKTIGGSCSMCSGQKTVSPLIKPEGYVSTRIAPHLTEFEEAVVSPKMIASKIDEWYGRSITDYSLGGLEWAKSMSWEALKSKYMEVLRG